VALLAVKSSKGDSPIRQIKSKLIIHYAETLAADLSVIFLGTGGTPAERSLVAYAVAKSTGKAVRSLADGALLTRPGMEQEALSSPPELDPDGVLHSVLQGDTAWVHFPEPATTEPVAAPRWRRAPRVADTAIDCRVAAEVALRAEWRRRRQRQAAEEATAEDQHVSVPDTAGAKRSVLVPVRLTITPEKARERIENVLKGIDTPAFLIEGVELEVTFGAPISAAEHLPPDDKEPDGKAVQALSAACEAAARRLYVVDIRHLFAALMRYHIGFTVTERDWRHRLFLAGKRLGCFEAEPQVPLQENLGKTLLQLLQEESVPRFNELFATYEELGLLRAAPHGYQKALFHRAATFPEEAARRVRALGASSKTVARVARTPGMLAAAQVRLHLAEEDQRLFDTEYARYYQEDMSKPPEVGRPFFLQPVRPRGGIVLIHGYMAAPLEVRAMADYFWRLGYAVYGVRLRGHGTAPADLAQRTWEEWYESINTGYAAIASMTDNIILGGFSMGAGLALLTAGRKKSRIRAAFAINAPLHLRNAAARFAPSITRVNALLRWFNRPRPQWEYLDNHPENKHINYTSNPVSGVAQLGAAMAAMDAMLKDVTAPTLVLQASRDPVVLPDSGPEIFSKLGTPYKELVILERDNHGIINGPRAKEVFDRIYQFLQWTESAS